MLSEKSIKNKKIGVGIIGASQGGWAVRAHLPALEKLKNQFKIVAVSTTNLESAKATAAAFGVLHAFDNEYDLISDPEVELVVVTVKVPAHKHLVETALKAGKMVFCEWPLGNGTAEAEYLNQLAIEKNIKTFCGLQAGSLPELKFVRDYIEGGNLGEVFSSTIVGAGDNWGTTLPDESLAYLLDPENGATMLHVPFAHTLNAVQFCLGNFKALAAMLIQRNQEVLITGSNKTVPQLSNDQIAVMGTLDKGTVVVMHYHGGENGGNNLQWEIHGSKSKLAISSPTGHMQFGKLNLAVSFGHEPMQSLMVPEQYNPKDGGEPGFGAELSRGLYYAYLQIAADIQEQTSIFPTFASAVRHQQLLETIERSTSKVIPLIVS